MVVNTCENQKITPLHCAREDCGRQTRRYDVKDGQIHCNDFICFFYFTDVYPGDGGLVVLDVSDPTNPTWVGNTSGYTMDVVVSGGYAYVADYYDGLVVVDVSDPTNLTWVGGLDTYDRAYDVEVVNGYAYVVHYYDGLVVVDVSDPANPTWAGGLDTFDYAMDVTIQSSVVMVPPNDLTITASGSLTGREKFKAFGGQGLNGDLHDNNVGNMWMSNGGITGVPISTASAQKASALSAR
mgnify:CR=1 FL=1